MNKKHIKVAYTSRLSGGSYTQVPKIQMEGRWLEELGFSIGRWRGAGWKNLAFPSEIPSWSNMGKVPCVSAQ